MLWVMLFPRPYHLAVGAVIVAPVFVLVVTYFRRDRLRLWQAPNEFRASTGQLIVLCILASVLRAIYDWRLLDWVAPIIAVLVAGTLIAVVVLIVSGKRFADRSQGLGAVLAGIAYSYGAVVPLNMWLDRGAPQTLRASVLELEPERIVIDAPPPFRERLDHSISRRLSEQLIDGGPICIYLYGGAFRMRSYDINACEGG